MFIPCIWLKLVSYIEIIQPCVSFGFFLPLFFIIRISSFFFNVKSHLCMLSQKPQPMYEKGVMHAKILFGHSVELKLKWNWRRSPCFTLDVSCMYGVTKTNNSIVWMLVHISIKIELSKVLATYMLNWTMDRLLLLNFPSWTYLTSSTCHMIKEVQLARNGTCKKEVDKSIILKDKSTSVRWRPTMNGNYRGT